MENEPKMQKSAWLSELESKSWSLEMTISGAATFAVSFFPSLVDRGLDFYLENLAPSTDHFNLIFPILSYSFFMVVSWVLIGFFVAHLCVRAVWVGAVGLHAAFPEGIRYDSLPNVSEFFKKLAKERLGTLEQYIFRLDKRSNKMFALAFALAMSFGGIGLLYLGVFGFALLLRNILAPDVLMLLGQFFYYFIIVFAVAIMVSNWWLKRHPELERFGTLMARLQMAFARISNPVFSKSLQYLSLTFTSNISRRSFYSGLVLIIGLMVSSTVFVTLKKMMQLAGREPLLFGRTYFAHGSAQYRLLNASYDALRPTEAAIPEISIPSDVVDGPYLPVFVKYPHYLDFRLSKFCGNLERPEEDSLSKMAAQYQADSLNIACLSRFFQLSINDTIRPATQWLFTEKNGSKGLITYLDTRNFPVGQNFMTVKIPSERNPDSLERFGALNFWRIPK